MTWAKLGLALLQLFNSLADLFRTKRDREAGANEAELKGHKIIQEIADDQDKRAADPLSDDDVVRRLRDKTG